MDTERTFMLATDHTRTFEYRARTHVFSLPKKLRKTHQIMPSPRQATRRKTGVQTTAFGIFTDSAPLCCGDVAAVVSQRGGRQAALADSVDLSRARPRHGHLLVSEQHAGTDGLRWR